MSERRQARRGRVYLGGRIVHRRIRSETNCVLRDMSPGGARLAVSQAVPLPASFDLVVDAHEMTRAVELIWRKGDEAGVRFAARSGSPEAPSQGRVAVAIERRSGDRRLH
ncbi:PilZ domain-containing protein [Methylobacterium sp. C25]|uniref:PilZ domain-containing protein n=1 Tax=Methylobacterium sp. C25 TaxID=2721622 RepID=UPI001F249640|nr:PilZ domain-containing protein [Methylobacterium sp. C25]MCE4224412.1 PilZ domain-containing protein [Methylobacterium sp. C25]